MSGVDSERLARLEGDVQHLRSTLEPLPQVLHTALERLAVVNERIATHLDDAKRHQERLDDQQDEIHVLQAQQKTLCAFCDLMKNLLWLVLTGGLAGLGWALQHWLDRHG